MERCYWCNKVEDAKLMVPNSTGTYCHQDCWKELGIALTEKALKELKEVQNHV